MPNPKQPTPEPAKGTEIRFTLSPSDRSVSDASLEHVRNDVLKAVQKHIDETLKIHWLEIIWGKSIFRAAE